ncbi:hypothetical protein UA08_07366 [Talaromyces atroroseus]|uniref:Transcription factor domain-containing protein n=1 Tax=Talaromyces atroroseus TaxID=1441469 RepID=A0A225AJ87_TALAT|nr:hypothetical protein UA08_07366 [Talaromyces atroroseus]OKL57208.1 hypothetical protein UA08_07366 [Talaromyces atroroseus]
MSRPACARLQVAMNTKDRSLILDNTCFQTTNPSTVRMVEKQRLHQWYLFQNPRRPGLGTGCQKYRQNRLFFPGQSPNSFYFLSHYLHTTANVMVNDSNVILLGVGALTLCFIENVRVDAAGTIYDHLLAAKTLLVKILADSRILITTDLRCFIIEYYIYTATLSMISTDVRVSNQNLLTDELIHHAESLVEAQYIGNMCGCWLELLLVIPSIFDLGRRWLTNGVEALNMDDMTQFAVIQHKVLQWKPNPSVQSDVTLLGLIYQQAILLYLYTVPSSSQHRKFVGVIGSTIDKAMGYMRELSPAAPVNTNMCWPIAIIGSLTTDFEQQQEIKNYLVAMNATLGFGNILQVLGILEEMWQHQGEQIGPWDICTAMQTLQTWISFS